MGDTNGHVLSEDAKWRTPQTHQHLYAIRHGTAYHNIRWKVALKKFPELAGEGYLFYLMYSRVFAVCFGNVQTQ